MSNPEIDRRCTQCGASVRSQALFCPQCGKAIPNADMSTDVVDGGSTMPIQMDAHWDPAETRPLMSIPELSETKPLAPPPTPPAAAPQLPPSPPPTNSQPNVVGREGIVGRVDKIRKASSVVIDQAAYDPSLRFILVAAVLFFLFLFLLILSKVLG
jgi:hypothetical protein